LGRFAWFAGENHVKISVKVDYACRVMAELARLHGSAELARIEHLAETEAVPANFLAQILLDLRNHGLISSRRGNRGGYMLARAAEEISLYDILMAVEGQCLQLSGNYQGRSGRRVKQVWDEISKTLVEKTKSYTLDLLSTKNPTEMYYI
jgi:Rrf2 family transcriptional regulator, cysteine metabolism repressor